MQKTLNFSKDYIVDKTIEETFSHFDEVISAPFNNSKFLMFGNFSSSDPPQFILMTKWFSIGRPLLPEVASTKLITTLHKDGNKTRITVSTKTNFSFIATLFILSGLFFITIFTVSKITDIKSPLICLLLFGLTIVVDRIVKKLVIAGFENDLKLIR
ncbi:MAG: hypothetical protein IPK31_13985 [Chitinophagaceae bacterium]|nr:hypothetical protein [Chitinophagaceae bacterium]